MDGVTSRATAIAETAHNVFTSVLGSAAAAFSGQEASAWATYLQTLQQGQPAGTRLPGLPALPPMQQFIIAPIPKAPEANKNQGMPPPIDWSNGTILREDVLPWTDPILPAHPTGAALTLEIGKDLSGRPIEITYWKAYSPWKVEYHYWCHGLTFAGGGPLSFSVWGQDVPKILGLYYTAIPQTAAKVGDIMVWKSAQGNVDHSCIISILVFFANGSIDPNKTMTNTKNGQNPQQTLSLAAVNATYPHDTVSIYTRK